MAFRSSQPEPSSALEAELVELRPVVLELPPTEPLMASLEAQLAAGERGLRGWLRSRSSRARYALAAGVAAAPGLWAVGEVGSSARAGAAWADVALRLLPAALLLYAAWLGLRPHSRRALGAHQMLGVLALCLGALLCVNAWPVTVAPTSAARTASVAACLGLGLSLAVPVYSWLRMLDRGDNPHGPALALAAGVSANLALNLHCAGLGPWHDVFGHFAVVAALLGAHALLAARASARGR